MLRDDLLALCLLIMLSLIFPVGAFPLTGGNGVVNATVYGVVERESVNGDGIVYCVDMSANESDYYSVILVDSEDIAHGTSLTSGGMANFNSADSSKYDPVSFNNGAFRDTIEIPVPDGTIIKRLKITPGGSDPFSIDWDGVPEVTANGIKLQFYKGESSEPKPKRLWVFDMKVTNLGNDTLTIPAFYMKDTTGWIYKGFNPRDKLVSGESLRFLVTFQGVGAASQPAQIICDLRPPITFADIPKIQAGEIPNPLDMPLNNVTMDIGAWV